MATISWEKFIHNPIPSLAPTAGTWRENASMTVDVVARGDQIQIFYVGKKNGQDSIGIATQPMDGFDGITWSDNPNNPVISPGQAGSYDSKHVVDPACLELEGRYYLYYSALGDGPDSIGLAISEDGLIFKKEEQPVLVGRAPEVVKVKDVIHLIYSLDHPNGGYAFHLATSVDGKKFREEGLIFAPDGLGWDCFSVVTPRIFHENDIYVMAYAGDNHDKDYPKNFGLAFSKDLRTWKRFSGNPVFSGGALGSWESRAIWFPEIMKHKNIYYLLYEGNNGSFSQVGLATSESSILDIARSVLNSN